MSDAGGRYSDEWQTGHTGEAACAHGVTQHAIIEAAAATTSTSTTTTNDGECYTTRSRALTRWWLIAVSHVADIYTHTAPPRRAPRQPQSSPQSLAPTSPYVTLYTSRCRRCALLPHSYVGSFVWFVIPDNLVIRISSSLPPVIKMCPLNSET